MVEFHAWESPAASAKLPCRTLDGSVGLAGLAGRPLVNRERVMCDGTMGRWDDILKTNSIANNKLFYGRPRHTASPGCAKPTYEVEVEAVIIRWLHSSLQITALTAHHTALFDTQPPVTRSF